MSDQDKQDNPITIVPDGGAGVTASIASTERTGFAATATIVDGVITGMTISAPGRSGLPDPAPDAETPAAPDES